MMRKRSSGFSADSPEEYLRKVSEKLPEENEEPVFTSDFQDMADDYKMILKSQSPLKRCLTLEEIEEQKWEE